MIEAQSMQNILPPGEDEHPPKRARVETECGAKVPMCCNCGLFAGYIDGKCSWCSVGKLEHNLPCVMSAENIERWIETGFHSITFESKCLVCLETKTLESNFCCQCPPTTCADCNLRISKCVYCKSGKYVRLKSVHISCLLLKDFNSHSLLSVVRDLLKDKLITDDIPFSFQRLLCPVSEIDEVVTTKLKLDSSSEAVERHWNRLQTIYCLAPDFYNTQCRGRSGVLCYKDLGMEYTAKTYKNICSSKAKVYHFSDSVNLMDMVVYFG